MDTRAALSAVDRRATDYDKQPPASLQVFFVCREFGKAFVNSPYASRIPGYARVASQTQGSAENKVYDSGRPPTILESTVERLEDCQNPGIFR